MSLRHKVFELCASWHRLPELIGDSWPELVPEIDAILARVASAADDGKRALWTSQLVELLEVYARVHDLLAAVEQEAMRNDPLVPPPPAWPDLTAALATAAAGQQWINARLYEAGLLVFEAGAMASSQALGSVRGSFVDQHEAETVLAVEVTSHDPTVEIIPVRPILTVPRHGPSADRAQFRVRSPSGEPAVVTARFLRDGNFVKAMTLEINFTGETIATVWSAGRTLRNVAALRPRQTSIMLLSHGDGYQIFLTGPMTMHAVLPHTAAQLDDLLAGVRKALHDTIFTHGIGQELPYQTSVRIPRDVYLETLPILAKAGYRLFQQIFFGPSSDAQLQRVGDALLTYLDMSPGRLQVVSGSLFLPWHLMYAVAEFDESNVEMSRFIGLRHVVEYLPLNASADLRAAEAEIDTSGGLNAVAVFNEDIDKDGARRLVADQIGYWRQLPGADIRTTGAEVMAFLTGPQKLNQLLYFFCHAVSNRLRQDGGPGGNSLIVGSPDGHITVEDLYTSAPPRRPFAGAPLVVLNACDSAGLSPLFYDGLLPYFIAKGARGVIGTEQQTPAVFAAAWADRFFGRLLAGEPVGEAMLNINLDFANAERNLLGLLYAPHCDADTVLIPAILPPHSGVEP